METVATARWLRRLTPAPPTAPRLVCLPHAGGTASYYTPLALALSGAVSVEAVQYPGRQERFGEAPSTSLEDLADRIAHVLAADQQASPDRPLALFGHSMGALLAFEVAGRLEAQNLDPTHVFASGTGAPSRRQVEEREGPRTDAELIEELAELDGTASEILADPEILELILPAVRADFEAVDTYQFRQLPALRCPLTALTGESDSGAEIADVRAWAEHSASTFDLHVYPGGHFYLTDQMPTIANLVMQHLVPK
jgi:pyochelin biosynthesis protein PchC